MRRSLLIAGLLLLSHRSAAASDPVAQLAGVVLDPAGRPVEGAVVALRYHASTPSFDLINHFPPVLTGPGGKFSLPVYEWAEGLKVMGWKSGFVPADSAVATLHGPGLVVRLERGTVVTFEILDRN